MVKAVVVGTTISQLLVSLTINEQSEKCLVHFFLLMLCYFARFLNASCRPLMNESTADRCLNSLC